MSTECHNTCRRMRFTLYKASKAWGLPSYSAASIQIEAYLRLAEIEVSGVDCSNPGSSPTGNLPALENADGDIFGKLGGEFETSQHLIDCLKAEGNDLDSKLSRIQQGQAVAFAALMRSQLEPATIYTSWCESESFSKHMRPVAGADLAIPLNYLTTWRRRRAHLNRFADTSPEEVYAQAGECYKAIAAQLSNSSGDYLLGEEPSSADALLYGHLALHLGAPVTSPELRAAIGSEGALRAYAERLAKHFEVRLPSPPAASPSHDWTERAEAASRGRRRSKRELSEKEKEQRRRNWLWLGAAGAVFVAYVVFSGQVIDFEYAYDEDDEEE